MSECYLAAANLKACKRPIQSGGTVESLTERMTEIVRERSPLRDFRLIPVSAKTAVIRRVREDPQQAQAETPVEQAMKAHVPVLPQTIRTGRITLLHVVRFDEGPSEGAISRRRRESERKQLLPLIVNLLSETGPICKPVADHDLPDEHSWRRFYSANGTDIEFLRIDVKPVRRDGTQDEGCRVVCRPNRGSL
jgi:hypothetical protein